MSGVPLRAVLFDAAGTLLHLREPAGETYARAARRLGVAAEAAAVSTAFARSLAAAPPMAFPDTPASHIDARERAWWRDVVAATFREAAPTMTAHQLEACFATLYEAFARPDAWRAAAGARDVLTGLRRRGLATAVVSNFDRRLPRLLEGHGLAPLLDAVVLPSDAAAAKPDPEIFRVALARIGCPAAAAVYVGDDPVDDVAGATDAGLRAVDVRELANLAELPARLSLCGTSTPQPRPEE